MLIATWNINSVRARIDRLLDWLERRRPDVVCLQEIKAMDEEFPSQLLQQAGYRSAVFGQKTWHGVAILAREEFTDIRRGMEDDPHDLQARMVAATVQGIRFVSVYVPNGGAVGSEKYRYKMQWLARFEQWVREELRTGRPLLIGGDFNIAPEKDDVAGPERWEGTVLFNPELREIFRALLDLGLNDLVRPWLQAPQYSWWDYRQLSFPRNDGLRLDHLLASDDLADRCRSAWIDRDERKGKQPSDHAPVLADLG